MTDLRTEIGLAILKAFERTYSKYNVNYDPDTCYEAADEVIALLMSNLTGETYVAIFSKTTIGPARFERVWT